MRAFLLIALVLWLALEATAAPEGEYLMGDSTGEKFCEVLTIHGAEATLMRVEEDGTPLETPIPMAVSGLGEGLCLLSSTLDEYPLRLYARFTSDNQAVVWYSGDNRLYWALRSIDEPLAPLQGDWEIVSDGTAMSGHIEGKTLVMKRQQSTVSLALSPVWADIEGVFRVVARPPSGGSFLLSFIRLGPDVWLVRNHNEVKGITLYRGTLEPWLEEELKAPRQGSSEP